MCSHCKSPDMPEAQFPHLANEEKDASLLGIGEDQMKYAGTSAASGIGGKAVYQALFHTVSDPPTSTSVQTVPCSFRCFCAQVIFLLRASLAHCRTRFTL